MSFYGNKFLILSKTFLTVTKSILHFETIRLKGIVIKIDYTFASIAMQGTELCFINYFMNSSQQTLLSSQRACNRI